MNAMILTLALAAPGDNDIRLTVEARTNAGTIACALYENSDTWMSKKVVTGATVKVRNHRAVCVFANVPAGDYAISIYHDENGNGELDTNFVGIPTEGYAFSRNAAGTFGPPNFEDAAFIHRAGRTVLKAAVIY